MSEKKTKTYTAEFKESAVKLAVESGQAVAVTARELGVNVNTLHTWIAKYHREKPAEKARQNDEHVYDELTPSPRKCKTERRASHIKKGGRLLCQGVSLRFQFISDNRGQFNLSAMCRIMSVSRSGFYEWLSRPASKRSKEYQALKADIRVIHEKNRQLYGERRIKDDLADLGKTVSRKRINRLMKEEELV